MNHEGNIWSIHQLLQRITVEEKQFKTWPLEEFAKGRIYLKFNMLCRNFGTKYKEFRSSFYFIVMSFFILRVRNSCLFVEILCQGLLQCVEIIKKYVRRKTFYSMNDDATNFSFFLYHSSSHWVADRWREREKKSVTMYKMATISCEMVLLCNIINNTQNVEGIIAQEMVQLHLAIVPNTGFLAKLPILTHFKCS